MLVQMTNIARYCIDCNDPRFWSEAENKFLPHFQSPNVPIVFVLTKFDIAIGQCFYKLMSGGKRSDDWKVMKEMASTEAIKLVKQNIHAPIETILRRDITSLVVSIEGGLASPSRPAIL